jgi:acyl dehydratase
MSEPANVTDPIREVQQRGLWFDELELDVQYRHSPGRTVSEADNTIFSTLTMNPQALHLDEAFSSGTEFGQRLVNSLLTMSIVVGLSVGHLTQGTIVANLGFADVRFPAPVLHGDTIYASTRVIDKRLSKSHPGAGVVTFMHCGHTQRGDLVAKFNRMTLMRCAPMAGNANAVLNGR